MVNAPKEKFDSASHVMSRCSPVRSLSPPFGFVTWSLAYDWEGVAIVKAYLLKSFAFCPAVSDTSTST